MFITNDFAANDPICQAAMAAYARALQIEEDRRQAILSGEYVPIPTTVWNISDRD